MRRVDNTIGYYAEDPRTVALPAGTYLVKTEAKDYFRVVVPVTIEPGRTTRLHLDGNWNFPADAPRNELVTLPNGNPAGWRAEATNEPGIN